jgi:uncharacterized membrane protein YtjA (UPF0391 family)
LRKSSAISQGAILQKGKQPSAQCGASKHKLLPTGDGSGSGGVGMLWTIFVILLVLWLVGLVSSYTLGGYIHILLLIALVVLVLQLITGRRPVV